MVTLQLNENQAQVLVQLLDVAVKAGGLNTAEAAIFFTKAIEQQLKEKQEQPTEQPTEEPS